MLMSEDALSKVYAGESLKKRAMLVYCKHPITLRSFLDGGF